MNFKLSLLFSLFFLLTACNDNDPVSQSCTDIDKTSENNVPLQVKVFTSKTVSFNISNKCDFPINIIETKIEGDNPEDFYLQGITNNTKITKSGINFNVVFTPKTIGQKRVIITIKHSTSEFVIHLSGEGI